MTPEELARHVVDLKKVGVWMWHCGMSNEPQDTARHLAMDSMSIYLECGPGLLTDSDSAKSVWEISDVVKKHMGRAYTQGGVCMLTGAPAMPAAQEVSLLIDCENGHHEWHDDVAKRSTQFRVVIDSVNATGLKEIARCQAKDAWARKFRATEEEIERGLKWATKNFLHAVRIGQNNLELIGEPPA